MMLFGKQSRVRWKKDLLHLALHSSKFLFFSVGIGNTTACNEVVIHIWSTTSLQEKRLRL